MELGLFVACMQSNIKFAVLMFAVHANPRKPQTFIPSKYTRYTVYRRQHSAYLKVVYLTAWYRIAGYFRGVFIFREQPIQFLFAKSNFTNGDTEPRLLHINYFHDFNFRGLAVLSRNSRNINASKITRYRVFKFCLSCEIITLYSLDTCKMLSPIIIY